MCCDDTRITHSNTVYLTNIHSSSHFYSDSDSGRHSGGRYGSVSSVALSSGTSDETPMRSASATAAATSDRAGSDAADAPAPQDGRTREDDGGGGGVMTRPPVVVVSNSTFDVDDGGKNAAEKSKDSMSCCQRTSLVLIAGACVRLSVYVWLME